MRGTTVNFLVVGDLSVLANYPHARGACFRLAVYSETVVKSTSMECLQTAAEI